MERTVQIPGEVKTTIGPSHAQGSPATSTASKAALGPQERPAYLPLSYAQQRFWFINKLRGASSEYNMPFGMRLTGELDRSMLDRALNTIVERHETLRTRFEETDGEPVQIIEQSLRIAVPLVDLSQLDEKTKAGQVIDALKQEGADPFDLRRGPLLRVKLLKLSEREHVCLQTMHHITSDGWSWGVFHRELVILYDAYVQGLDNPLKPLPVQYADFTLWHRKWLEGGALDEGLAYWKRQLANIPQQPELPADRPRSVQAFKAGVYETTLAVNQTTSLKQLSRDNQATLYMTLLGAFSLLLSRYGGGDDIVVGSPIANRQHPHLEKMIGVFVNTIAMRMRIKPESSFLRLLEDVKQTTWQAYQHQDVPFDRLVEALSPDRSLDRTPLFQSVLVLQSAPWKLEPLGTPLKVEPFFGDAAQARFDLEVHVWDTQGRLDLRWLYNRDLFDPWRIEQMARHYFTILNAVAARPEQPIENINLLRWEEEQKILREWNETKKALPDTTLVELFHQQVEDTPDAVALVYDGHQLTYTEVNCRANRLADHLRRRGLQPEDRVGVAQPRSLEMVIGLVAVLEAGGAYLPLDPNYPAERLGFMIADASVKILLCDRSLAATLAGTDSDLVTIDPAGDPFDGEPSPAPLGLAGSRNIAYVIYTSGSTGKPKGVAVEHRSAAAFLLWAETVFGPEDRIEVIASTSICFDLSVFELFLPLCRGGKIVLAQSALDIVDLSRTNRPTLLNTVPSAMAEILRISAIPESVRAVNLAGEPLSNALVTAIRQNTNARVFDLYGPSETTTYSTYAAREPGGPETIGKPILNAQAYVLDNHLRPAPVGVIGELHIGGLGVSRCYLNRPGLTAERFVADPWGEPGARMYRTGDMVRWSADGTLQYLRRIDDQVKVRGFRIEPREIEATLRSHSQVQDAAVIVREDGEEKSFIGYVTRTETVAEREQARSLQINQWQQLYDSIYEQTDETSGAFNLAGWINSYTGQPIAPDEMKIWVQETVSRLKDLQAKRVVEIGCGTGLLLSSLATGCVSYIGVDFSRVVLDRLAGYLSGRPELSHVKLNHGLAHDLRFIADASVDLVIMNSVIQYFPDVHYLMDVLSEAVRVTKCGGHIFLGDVRNLALLEAYHSSVQMHKGCAGTTLAEVKKRVEQMIRDEEELLVDARFFEELGRRWQKIGRVTASLKAGNYDNELSRFRYDVLVMLGEREEILEPDRLLSWDEDGHWQTEVERELFEAPSISIAVRKFKDWRVAPAVKAAQMLANGTSDMRLDQAREAVGERAGEDPEAVMALARRLGVEVVWQRFGPDGVYDLIFAPRWRGADRVDDAPVGLYARFANTPSTSTGGVELVQDLKRYLGQKLPDYMVPPAIVVMQSLPLTPNGKLDRRRLPLPEFTASHDTYCAPRTPEEEILCESFAQVLGVERAGLNDNFFELGGHSLMATRLTSRIRSLLGADISVRTVFEAPSVAQLVTRLREARSRRPILERQPQPAHLPLSYAQQRLWFIDKLNTSSSEYNLPAGWILRGELDQPALERALNTIMERHESLRTHFVEIGGEPVQVIEQHYQIALPVAELTGSDQQPQTDRVIEAMNREKATPFDLSRGPLVRFKLLRLGEREHVLLRTAHHITWDGWSESVFNRELEQLYDAYRQGLENPLKPLTVQYADFTLWQRTWLEGGVLDEELSYWKEQLAGTPERLELPADRRPRDLQAFSAGALQTVLPANQVAALKQVSRDNQGTLYMTLLAAFIALLWRYSEQDDILVATPIANREDAEAEKMIGFFVNLLLMRIRINGELSFQHLLAGVRETTLAAYQHQDVPFERLVQEIAPLRTVGTTPILQILFALQNAPSTAARLDGLHLQQLETGGLQLPADLALHAIAGDQGALRLYWFYNSELFDHWRIEQMAGHYGRVLQAMCEDITQRAGSFPLLTPEERVRVLTDWNDTQRDVPAGTVADLFEQQVRRRPEALAAICSEECVTYALLNERASRLASLLIGEGIRQGLSVALLIPRSIDLVVSILAIAKAGATYLPIEPDCPQERLSLIVEDSKPSCILITRELSRHFSIECPQIVIDDAATIASLDRDIDVREAAASSTRPYHPEQSCYVVYTSGSTGTPKGVVVPQRALLNKIFTWNAALQTSPATRYAVLSSVSFDPLSEEVWSPLCGGGVAVIVPDQVRRRLDDFAEYIDRQAPTLLPMSPPLTEHWSHHGRVSMDFIIVGGDVLEAALVNRLLRNRSARRIFNVYGPTETCIDASWYEAKGEQSSPAVPIGKPAPNYQLYLLDRRLEPVPAGVNGELYIGGAGLSSGYLNQPALTAERFIPNPHGDAGSRMFRTGDLARWRIDANLEFIGRVDTQVKIRGYRIEPGEVEAALREYPGIREAAVMAREDVPREKRLVGYVVWSDGSNGDFGELRNYLRLRLPSFMIPAALVALKDLPLTVSGKVDRKALPAPDGRPERATYVAARTPMEEVLSGIWTEVLALESVSTHDSFFDLGGHSLLATRMIAQVGHALNIELPLRDIFAKPTIAELAKHYDELQRTGAGLSMPPVAVRKQQGPAPLSFAQERLWFLEQLGMAGAAFNLTTAYRLHGVLDVGALENSLAQLVSRHESLRTRFEPINGEANQVIEPAAEFRVDLYDVSQLADDLREHQAERWRQEQSEKPFDLVRGPLFRVCLVRLATDDHELQITIHHIVSDGWSMGVMVRELGALYAALIAGRTAGIPELPIQYADYAQWQRDWLVGDILQQQLAYWSERLNTVPSLELSTDYPRPPVPSFKGGVVRLELPPELARRLEKIAREHGATLYMVLLAAMQALLGRWSGQDDIVVGSPIAGRRHWETEGLIGCFVNMLALRTDLSGRPVFRELISRVKDITLGAYAHQDLPFEKIVAELQPERDLSRQPIFQVVFALQNVPEEELELPGLKLRTLEVDRMSSAFELAVFMQSTASAFYVHIEYATDLFDRTTIERLANHWGRLLDGVVTNPEKGVEWADLLGPDESRQIIEEWNETAIAVPERTVAELFEEQVERAPWTIAVICGIEMLSYSELNEQANRLAHALIEHGIGPEDVVGIALERSLEMVVTLLAVLKSGAAYLPLDPGYPAERLAFMLEDVKPVCTITERATAGRLPNINTRIILDAPEVAGKLAHGPANNPNNRNRVRPLTAQNSAYLTYTSGSTGQPKASIGLHSGLVNRLIWFGHVYDSLQEEPVLAKSSISFIDGSTELLAPLLHGVTIVLANSTEAKSASEIATLISRHGVGLVTMVPSLLSAILEEVDAKMLISCRVWVVDGETLLRSQVAEFERLLPGTQLLNLYGASEVSGDSTIAECGRSDVSIGRPIWNTQVYLLDENMQVVPVGVAGELYLAGIGLARGYLKRPELTAERFVANPNGKQPGERLYRTGDIARWRADGSLEFIGRADRQVKIRGNRIELGEIEATLREYIRAGQAAVVLRDDSPGEKKIVGYVVWRDGNGGDVGELRNYLKERLPDYMIPSAIVVLESLPLTPNGKLDRKALPSPEGRLEGAAHVAARTSTEETLIGIWSRVLHVERVGIHDDFFELGGHSLLATRMIAQVRHALRIEVPLQDVFRKPTIAEFAICCEELQLATDERALSPLIARSRLRQSSQPEQN